MIIGGETFSLSVDGMYVFVCPSSGDGREWTNRPFMIIVRLRDFP